MLSCPLFSFRGFGAQGLHQIADHLRSPMASHDAKDYVAVIVKLLYTARAQAKELHRLLSTFPILRVPMGGNLGLEVTPLA